MADFLGILLVIASKQTIFMNKIHRNNCCTRKKSQGIPKNGSQEAGETANVIKIEKHASNEQESTSTCPVWLCFARAARFIAYNHLVVTYCSFPFLFFSQNKVGQTD